MAVGRNEERMTEHVRLLLDGGASVDVYEDNYSGLCKDGSVAQMIWKKTKRSTSCRPRSR